MGEHADDALNACIEQWAEDSLAIDEQLSCTNSELVDFTAGARLPLIVGIRRHYEKYGSLSRKQRYCLARWIVEHDDPDQP
jgi:hypothetical protein